MNKILTFSIIIVMIFLILSIKSFTNIIDYDYVDITKIKMRDPGDGRLYVTKDEKMIDMFISMMEQSRYLRFIKIDTVVGTSTYKLYSEDDNEIISITFIGENYIKFNNKFYLIITNYKNELINFHNSFYVEGNVKYQ
jgi:hypothetical protein